MREVEMAQSMAADLEIGVGNQLLGALFVGLHPFAAGEERGLHALGAEKVDDPPVIAGDVAVGLAEIEGDPHYDEVAISARNAVLASSPLALPAGQYDDVMDMLIYMNPRDTLR